MRIDDMISIDKTIAKDLFDDKNYYFEVLSELEEKIILLGKNLDKSKYQEIEKNIWIGKNVTIDKLATIEGPCIIDDNTCIRASAYLRGNVIIGKNCVIGSGVEIKKAIIFDECNIAHFNYVGDSILGYKVHLGAGVILSNLKSDGSNVIIKNSEMSVDTGLRKLGSLIGDYVNIGCNSVSYPGTMIGKNTDIYPLTRIRGIINENSIMKDENIIVKKEI